MLDRPDTGGLVCGYKVDASSGEMSRLDWDSMDAAIADPDNIVWLHFSLVDARARDWIAASPAIPTGAKAVLLGRDAHMRIEVCGETLAGVVGDLHREFAEKSDTIEVLRLFLDKRCLISARRCPLDGIDKLRHAIADGLKITQPTGLVAQFLHHVTDTLGDLLIQLSEDVDDLEDEILVGGAAERAPELARIRRVAVRLRRHLVPQQHALVGLASRMPAWIDAEDATRLRSAIERLGALGHDLDLVQERARLVGDQIAARLMEATNRNLYVLSIVTTVFLPMTLVTGIFGMNLGGLPAQQDPRGFWYGIAIMLGLGVVTYAWLRRRRMF